MSTLSAPLPETPIWATPPRSSQSLKSALDSSLVSRVSSSQLASLESVPSPTTIQFTSAGPDASSTSGSFPITTPTTGLSSFPIYSKSIVTRTPSSPVDSDTSSGIYHSSTPFPGTSAPPGASELLPWVYIVIGVSAFFVIILLALLCCIACSLCMKWRKKRRQTRTYLTEDVGTYVNNSLLMETAMEHEHMELSRYEQTITHDTRIQPKDPPFLLHATKPYQELIPTDMDKSYASLVKDTRRTDDMSSCSKSGELLTAPNPKKNASLSTSESDPAAAVAAILMAGSAVRHTPHLPVQEKTKYDKPPNDVNALFAQFEKKRYTYIPKELVKAQKEIGHGFFGAVYKGIWDSKNGIVNVAIKSMKKDAQKEEQLKFLQEAAIMGQFKHPNIVGLYGVIPYSRSSNCAIVLELMTNGDLKHHLKHIRLLVSKKNSSKVCYKLLDYARDIASGMNYLSSKSFIHRDLACRNVLLDGNYTCKIGDFGLSKDLKDSEYYRSKGGLISWKWTAPEALKYGHFSTASDVWSFGCILFEIWSLGQTPMKANEREQIIQMLTKAYRSPPPPGCPRKIYKIMIECWHPDQKMRPSFLELYKYLLDRDDSLLHWSSDDNIPEMFKYLAGEELETTSDYVSVYSDLQNKYARLLECSTKSDFSYI